MIEASFNIQPVTPVRKIVKAYHFDGLVGNDPTPRPFIVMFPMDRRQARRYARRSGRQFSICGDGVMRWRERKG
jgi:hypothetical protein